MDLGVGELLIIAFIVVLLFGSKKLPGAARSIGQSLKIFKDETKGLRGDENAVPEPPQAALPPAEPTPPAAATQSDSVATPRS